MLIHAIEDLAGRPNLLVASRLADEVLWAEVLAEPFDEEEVFRIVSPACR